MTYDETNMKARHETAAGSLERITFPVEDDGEKSLLTLIEEHGPLQSERPPTAATVFISISPVDPPDAVEEDEDYRIDHLMMRLGGNGF
jgi:hypothetical protein